MDRHESATLLSSSLRLRLSYRHRHRDRLRQDKPTGCLPRNIHLPYNRWLLHPAMVDPSQCTLWGCFLNYSWSLSWRPWIPCMGSQQRRRPVVSRRVYGVGSDLWHCWWHTFDLVSQLSANTPLSIKLMHYRIYTVNDAPRYFTGHMVNLSGQIGVCLLSCAAIAYCKWENKQKDLGKRNYRLNEPSPIDVGESSNKHPDFRYMY